MTDKRTEENKEFKQAKKDDEDSIVLLEKARDVMSDFYKKNAIKVDLMQTDQSPEKSAQYDAGQTPEFSDKGKRKNQSKGIVALLNMIIEDLGAEITNGVKAEEEGREAGRGERPEGKRGRLEG